MGDLFSPIDIGTMRVPNRFVRSATHAYMAPEDGSMSEREIALAEGLALGGVGLVVMGHAYVRKDGKCSAGMVGLDSDEKIEGFARVARRVHAAAGANGTKVVAQINFGGAQASIPQAGPRLLAPSARDDVAEAHAFSEPEAEELIHVYVEAARRARDAGLDGVQLHGAHGYFLNQTLSPRTNRRSDRYGGSLEGRSRLLKEVIVGIRECLGRGFPLLMKIASHDGLPDGLTLEDCVAVVAMAEGWGLDAIEVSGGMRSGMNMRRPRTQSDEGYFLAQAAAIKARVRMPVISVHGYRTLSVMRDAVGSGGADMIALCRPLICEPDLVKRLQAGQEKAACISCNECGKKALEHGLQCWLER